MTNILCSVMLASYKRPALLRRAISSLVNQCEDPSRIEILVRLSEEDHLTLPKRKLYEALGPVEVHVGPQLSGYLSLATYLNQLADIARGQWVSIFDDDMTIEGAYWDSALINIQPPAMVLCERYTLGPSKYPKGSCDGPGIGWFVPNGCWRWLGEPLLKMPPDTWMKQLLVNQHGWRIEHLQGVLLNHQWMRTGEPQ